MADVVEIFFLSFVGDSCFPCCAIESMFQREVALSVNGKKCAFEKTRSPSWRFKSTYRTQMCFVGGGVGRGSYFAEVGN